MSTRCVLFRQQHLAELTMIRLIGSWHTLSIRLAYDALKGILEGDGIMWKFFKLSFLGFLINHSMAMGALGLPNGVPIQSAELQAVEKGYRLAVGKILKSVDGISAGGKINLLERTSIKFLNISELKEKRKTEMINMGSMPGGKSHKTLFESCQTFLANYMVSIAPLMTQQTEPRNAQAVPVEVEICSRIQE